MFGRQTIKYNAFGVDARIVVSAATVAMGFERSRLVDEGLREAAKQDRDPMYRTAQWLQWPAIKASIVDGTITIYDSEEELKAGKPSRVIEDLANDLTFDDFLSLPEELAVQWLGAVLTLNPHWSLAGVGQQATQKSPEKKSDEQKINSISGKD